MSRSLRRITVALAFALMTAGAAQARPEAPVRQALVTPAPGSLLDAWDRLISRLRALAKPQSKAGCGMDPDGKPIPCK